MIELTTMMILYPFTIAPGRQPCRIETLLPLTVLAFLGPAILTAGPLVNS